MRDVPLDKSKPASVRLTLGVRDSDWAKKSVWFRDLMDHVRQPDAGAPAMDKKCHLFVEALHTSGLIGDHTAPQVPAAVSNTSFP